MEEMKLTETEHTDLDELHLLPFTDPLLKRKPKPFDFDKEDAKAIKDWDRIFKRKKMIEIYGKPRCPFCDRAKAL